MAVPMKAGERGEVNLFHTGHHRCPRWAKPVTLRNYRESVDIRAQAKHGRYRSGYIQPISSFHNYLLLKTF
jgi:hypothetical protein